MVRDDSVPCAEAEMLWGVTIDAYCHTRDNNHFLNSMLSLPRSILANEARQLPTGGQIGWDGIFLGTFSTTVVSQMVGELF